MCSESTVSPFESSVLRSPASGGVETAVTGANDLRHASPIRHGGRDPRRHSRAGASAALAAARRHSAAATAPLSSRRRPRDDPFASSGVPSGFGTSAFIDRRRRPRSSRSMSFTLHAVALLDDVFGLLRAAVRELGDVHQPFRARHDLDERAERRRALHRALVRLRRSTGSAVSALTI